VKRKKFVKMLMGAGMSRNDAADVAQLAQEAGRPYFNVMGDLLNFHRQDFGNPLAWMKMRHTIIHGHNSPAGRFFANIDEMANHKDPAVEQALAAGTAAKPQPVAADHDTLHGYACGGYVSGIDLAAGSDMTAYKPCIRLDGMVIDAGPVIPDMTKKTATELADEIMEKLQPPGGGGHD
jgi:hypothetical protein